MGYLKEKLTKVFGGHMNNRGKLFQSNRRGIRIFNKSQNLFYQMDTLVIPGSLGHICKIQMFTIDNAKKMIELS